MRTTLVIVFSPCLNFNLSILVVFEPMKVQTFISKTSIEGLYECVVRWFARPRKGQCNLVSVGLEVRYPASELTAIVTKDPAGNASFMNYLCQRFDDIFTFQLWANSGSQALPRKSVDHG